MKRNLLEEMRLHRTSSPNEAVRLEDPSVGHFSLLTAGHVMSSRIATFLMSGDWAWKRDSFFIEHVKDCAYATGIRGPSR